MKKELEKRIIYKLEDWLLESLRTEGEDRSVTIENVKFIPELDYWKVTLRKSDERSSGVCFGVGPEYGVSPEMKEHTGFHTKISKNGDFYSVIETALEKFDEIYD